VSSPNPYLEACWLSSQQAGHVAVGILSASLEGASSPAASRSPDRRELVARLVQATVHAGGCSACSIGDCARALFALRDASRLTPEVIAVLAAAKVSTLK